jgi:hypothetical protein
MAASSGEASCGARLIPHQIPIADELVGAPASGQGAQALQCCDGFEG